MNLSYVTGHGVSGDILCKFFKIFNFFKCCSDLGRFLALQFGDYNIHNNIKLFAIFTTDLIFHGPIYLRKSSKLLPCLHLHLPFHLHLEVSLVTWPKELLLTHHLQTVSVHP